MRKRWIIALMAVTAIAVFSISASAQGCAMCKTALEQSTEGRAIANSFNYGILFLMGIPYAMFGVAGIAIYRAYRMKKRESRSES